MARADVLIVSLGSTPGWRTADQELADSLKRAGASVAIAVANPVRRLRTFALTDYAWARSARLAAEQGIKSHFPRTIIYSTTTAAAFAPQPGAIRFDAVAADNRPGRHGVWQRPLDARRLRTMPLLLPCSHGALNKISTNVADKTVVVPIAVEASGLQPPARDISAITYAKDPHKKGLDRVLAAWRTARKPGEMLVVVGTKGECESGVEFCELIERDRYRQLLRRARVFVTAPRREDYGIAQLEALADGCILVTTPSAGPYAALPVARDLDPRLVGNDLVSAIRSALDDPRTGYSERAGELMLPFRRESVDRVVAEKVLPRLLG